MNRITISARLILLTGVMCLLLLGIGFSGLSATSSSNEALRTVYEDRAVPIAQLGRVELLLTRNRLAVANALLGNSTPADVEKFVAELDSNEAEISKQWSAYIATSLTPEEAKLVENYKAARERYVNEAQKPVLAKLKANDPAGALELIATRVRPLSVGVRESIEKLLNLQNDVAKVEYAQAVERFHTVRAWSIAAIVAGIAFAAVFGAMLLRGMARDLRYAGDVVDTIAAGDLTQPVKVDGKDEIATLLSAMRKMQESLRSVVSSVRTNADGVASASSQIAKGNMDLSQRTEEQASALEQTAATMDQLSSTVRNNAESAQQARQLASDASAIANRGGDAVAEVITTMRSIQSSSRRIADIIGVIDGIAFQTNILALNAAVEAARAGEQGRGFAVVASEVRSLAGRSAEAAKEISSLINESVGQVEKGTAQVDGAGDTMKEIVTAIQRVSDIVGEISVASSEQAQGVSQVGEAVSQMDQVTQQNAALVEQSAAAAESLKDQARNLVDTMAVFRVNGMQPA